MLTIKLDNGRAVKLTDAAVQRFRLSYEVTSKGCWLWCGVVRSDGYAVFAVDDVRLRAHRVSYLLVNGEIARGLHLDHLCRVRHCVNPAHLEPVTTKINTRRGLRARQAQAWRPRYKLRGTMTGRAG